MQYDQIRERLQAKLELATYQHAREDTEESGDTLKEAQDRYDRFALNRNDSRRSRGPGLSGVPHRLLNEAGSRAMAPERPNTC
jgi:hypothetical protein